MQRCSPPATVRRWGKARLVAVVGHGLVELRLADLDDVVHEPRGAGEEGRHVLDGELHQVAHIDGEDVGGARQSATGPWMERHDSGGGADSFTSSHILSRALASPRIAACSWCKR